MVAPISALANMEMALYGGLGLNAAAPSYLNGYMGGSGAYNMASPYMGVPYSPYMNQAGMYNQLPYLQPAVSNQTPAAVSQADIDVLADYYKKSNVVEESFSSGITGGLMFAAMENPQSLAHPYNAIKAVKPTDAIFKGIKEGGELHKLWTGKDTRLIMQDAYSQMYRVNKNAQSKWITSKWFISPMKESERAALEKIMKEALATKDPEKIKLATEQLRAACKCNGRIPQAFNWIKGTITGNKQPLKTPTQLAQEALTSGSAAKAVASKSAGLLKAGMKEGPMWILMELGMDLLFTKNIQTAFSKDAKTGWTQVGQTTLKGAGSAAGWVAGRAAGTWAGAWAGAKLGAIAGSAVPGLGTAVGALVGFIGGSLGMWAMGKLAKKVVGEDVGEKVKRENMKKTPEGQIQLLQLTLQKAQEGAPMDERVLQAAQNLALKYQNVA